MTSILIATALTLTGPPAPGLTLKSRDVRQVQGDWTATYTFINPTGTTIHIDPSDITGRISGDASNSSIPAHGTPRSIVHVIDGSSSAASFADVIPSEDAARRCRERLSIQRWVGDDMLDDVGHMGDVPAFREVNLLPLDTLSIRMRLDHDHEVFGEFNPLLGTRAVEIHVGNCIIYDTLPMDIEKYRAIPRDTWGAIPEEHRDDKMYWSGPDSLRLIADEPDASYFRYPELKVRYSTRYRLSFRYFLARGCDGKLMARIAQYRESPNAWRPLSDGAWEGELNVVGRWTEVVRVFRSEDEATTFALDFRLAGAEEGVAWIDDTRLEVVGNPAIQGDTP